MRPRTCRNSAWRALSPLVFSALAAPVAATNGLRYRHHAMDSDSAKPQTRAVAACSGDVRLFLELSALGLLTVGLAVVARRVASHCRRLRRPQQRQDIAADKATATRSSPSALSVRTGGTTWGRSTGSTASVDGQQQRLNFVGVVGRAVAALSMAAWAVAGLVFASSTSTPADEVSRLLNDDCNGWEAAAAAIIGGAGLLVALWLLGALAADVVATTLVRPPNETPAVLKCFRCSCCSFALARGLVLLPLVALSALATRSWLRATSFPVSACEPKLPALFAAATIVFTLMTLTAAAVIAASAFSSQNSRCWHPMPCLKRSSHTSNDVDGPASRRTTRLAVALTLVVLALTAITWAILGLVWLSPVHSQAKTACADDADTVAAVDEAKVCVVALLVVGIALLATTMCCRLEVFLLATGAAPSVDVLMLSPSLGATDRTERAMGGANNSSQPSTPKVITIV